MNAEAVEQVVEKYLSREWKAGRLTREDERDVPILRNAPGFSRLFTRVLNERYVTKEALLQEVTSAFGYGTYHHGRGPHGYPERRKMIRDLTNAVWKLRETPTRTNPRRPISPEERVAKIRKIVEERQAARVDGTLVDGFSASAYIQVFDHLNADNKLKMASMTVQRAMPIVWKFVK